MKMDAHHRRVPTLLLLCLLVNSVILSKGQEALAQTSPSINQNELKEIVLDTDESSLEASLEAGLAQLNTNRQLDVYYLQKAKFKLISGDLKMATFFLSNIRDDRSVLTAIKKRYLAIISFIQGRFDQSLAEINDLSIKDSREHYTQTCLLKLINLMAVHDVEKLNREKADCMIATSKYSKNDQFWLDSMIKLKNHDAEGLKKNLTNDVDRTMASDEMSKLWFKTGLYLNKEKDLLTLLSILPQSSYQSKKLREIIAFLYLRDGEPHRALSFVEDIDSANAENIKGNINLANKEYELALGHFKLAIQKKSDSANSLERAVPLAWLLGQWEDGLNMLENMSNHTLDPRKKAAARIAFLIRHQKFSAAQQELTLLKIAFQNEPPYEVNIMDAYVSLMLATKAKNFEKNKIEESVEKSCRSFDGLSCWIALQFLEWDNLGKTIQREEPIVGDSSAMVEALKEKKEIHPLVEDRTIDQGDIEELDGFKTHLMPMLN